MVLKTHSPRSAQPWRLACLHAVSFVHRTAAISFHEFDYCYKIYLTVFVNFVGTFVKKAVFSSSLCQLILSREVQLFFHIKMPVEVLTNPPILGAYPKRQYFLLGAVHRTGSQWQRKKIRGLLFCHSTTSVRQYVNVM